jgi:O-antigen ligase
VREQKCYARVTGSRPGARVTPLQSTFPQLLPRPHSDLARAGIPSAVSGNPLRTVAGLTMLMFLFTVQARLLEVFYVPGLAMILALFALGGAIVGGDIIDAVRSRVGLLLITLTVWMIAITPMSVWPGGSISMLKEIWIKNALVFFILVPVLVKSNECVRTFYVMAAATATIVILSFKHATMSSGRLHFYSGTLANPNDLASYLLVGAPFCMFALQRAGNAMKAIWLVSLVMVLNMVLKTGSRAGLLTLGCIAIYVFFKSRPMVKLAMGMIALLGALCAPFLLPRSVLDRYALIFSTSSANELDSQQAEYAAGSTESRTRMLQLSLDLTIHNPIFGVGPGMFAVAGADAAKEEGQRAAWLQTHNLYTQVSSETGIPGFIIYLFTLIVGFRNIGYAKKRAGHFNPELSDMASWLRVSYLAFLFTGFFSSTAFHLNIILLLAFSQALRNAADLESRFAPANSFPTFGPAQVGR